MGQLGPCTRTAKPSCPELVLCNKRSHHTEKPDHHNEEQHPCLPQLEKAPAQQWRPSIAKKKKSYLKKNVPVLQDSASHSLLKLQCAQRIFLRSRSAFVTLLLKTPQQPLLFLSKISRSQQGSWGSARTACSGLPSCFLHYIALSFFELHPHLSPPTSLTVLFATANIFSLLGMFFLFFA